MFYIYPKKETENNLMKRLNSTEIFFFRRRNCEFNRKKQ